MSLYQCSLIKRYYIISALQRGSEQAGEESKQWKGTLAEWVLASGNHKPGEGKDKGKGGGKAKGKGALAPPLPQSPHTSAWLGHETFDPTCGADKYMIMRQDTAFVITTLTWAGHQPARAGTCMR